MESGEAVDSCRKIPTEDFRVPWLGCGITPRLFTELKLVPMQPALREFGIPIAIGFTCHVTLFLLEWCVTWQLFPNGAEGVTNHWYFEVAPWVNTAQALLPGFLTGYFARRHPMLCGASAVFIASTLCSTFVGNWWLPPYSIHALWWVTQSGVTTALVGLAGAAAGFLTRGMFTNYSSKPTADAAA